METKEEVLNEIRKIAKKELKKDKEETKKTLIYNAEIEMRKKVKEWIFEYYEESREEHLKKYSNEDTKNTIIKNVKKELEKEFEVEADLHVTMVLATPAPKDRPRYKFGEMIEYAKEKGVEIDQLSKREARKFIIGVKEE